MNKKEMLKECIEETRKDMSELGKFITNTTEYNITYYKCLGNKMKVKGLDKELKIFQEEFNKILNIN